MRSNQYKLERLVVDYFRARTDTSIRSDGEGTYCIRLDSESALEAFGGSEQVRIVFDGERLSEESDVVLIDPNHPFLDIIRNTLESDEYSDIRISEAHLPVQMLNQYGSFEVPGLSNACRTSFTGLQLRYYPTFLVVYRVVYQTDERLENIVHLAYTSEGNRLDNLPASMVEQYLSAGPPETEEAPEETDLSQLLRKTRGEIESRVQKDIALFANERIELRNAEEDRLEKFFANEASELRRNDIVGREELKNREENELEDMERKLSIEVAIKPISVLKIWWPFVKYKVKAKGSRFEYALEDILYQAPNKAANFKPCSQCGNKGFFSVCMTGKHLSCEGSCGKQAIICSKCKDPACPDHGGRCRVGGEWLCLTPDGVDSCGLICEHCGEVTCLVHGERTVEDTWACKDHAATSTCCGRVFALSRLRSCCVCADELLCPNHRFECSECGGAVCEKHSFQVATGTGRVCENCRAFCELCGPDKNYTISEVTACVTCEKLFCGNHMETCSVCGNGVCESDALRDTKGNVFCQADGGRCHLCEHEVSVYNMADLSTCAICGKYVCGEHAMLCQVCQHNLIGTDHVKELQTCPCCGRISCNIGDCSAHDQVCLACGIPHCVICSTSSGICTTCMNLSRFPFDEAMAAYVDDACGIPGESSEFLKSALRHPSRIQVKSASNLTYMILVVECDPAWYWKKRKLLAGNQVRLVIERAGNRTVAAKLETRTQQR